MEARDLAEELPTLYRAILDRVAALEAEGFRDRAGRLRMDATAIYSRGWDERARRDLESLMRRYTLKEVPHTVEVDRRLTRRESVSTP